MNGGNAPIFLDVEQRGDEWHSLHLGRPSASQFFRIVSSKGKNKGARKVETAQTYKWQLLAERIFGVSFAPKIDRFAAVKWGVRFEDQARDDLAKRIKREILPGGVVMDRAKRMLASPDGWISRVGYTPVEIKCPQPPGQLENLLTDPEDYWPQIQGQMMLAQVDELCFWSWHPCTPAKLIEVQRDFAFCNSLNHELQLFCDELDRDEAELRALGAYDVELFKELMKPKEVEEGDEAG